MCGICGEIRFDGSTPDVAAVGRITEAMALRGPDGEGVWSSGPVAFGHRRLAIIDLSRRGDQPMVDPDAGLSVVFNGCIYNHRELRGQLEARGHRFFSTSDTEVILRGYREWGTDVVDHLQGMFAFAVAERESGRCVLARDRLGIKPLYLTEDGRRMRFASSLPALLRGGGVNTDVDPVALHHYLTFHAVVPAPRTLLEGVAKLPPATVMVVEPDGSRRPARVLGPRVRARASTPGRSEEEWRGRGRAGPCAWPWSVGSWPTCRSGSCSRAGSTPASSWPCWPRRARPGWRPSASASSPPGGRRATSSTGRTRWPSATAHTTTGPWSRPATCSPPYRAPWTP